MGATGWLILWMILGAVTPAGPADGRGRATAGGPGVSGEGIAAIHPAIAEEFPAKLRWLISTGTDLAVQRLREDPDCSGLFVPFGLDGIGLLAAARYHLPSCDAEARTCRRRGAAAFTTVRGRRTGICPQAFSQVTREQAAVLLIHEALHHAGLGEGPADPAAPTSEEINRRVRRACGL